MVKKQKKEDIIIEIPKGRMEEIEKEREDFDIFAKNMVGVFHGLENMFSTGIVVKIVNENINRDPKTFGDLKKQDVVKCGDRIMVCVHQESDSFTKLINIKSNDFFGKSVSMEKTESFDEYLGKIIVEEREF